MERATSGSTSGSGVADLNRAQFGNELVELVKRVDVWSAGMENALSDTSEIASFIQVFAQEDAKEVMGRLKTLDAEDQFIRKEEMGREGSDYGSDESGMSELSGDDSFDYVGSGDTRLRSRKDMSVAQWDAARGTAEVVVKKGKAWIATGFTRGSRHAIYIEEAVFMVEQGSLLLLEGARVVDLLEAYSLVSSPSFGCSWDNYQVYSYLRKLGYIVGRHNIPWTGPKRRPPMPVAELENLTSQFAAVKTSEGAQENDTFDFQLRSVESENVCSSEVNTERSTSTEVSAILSIHEAVKTQVIGELQGSESRTSELKLIYDVHLPNARFKKSNPGLPAYSLCTTSDNPPHRLQVRALKQSIGGRPLKFAAVVCDHITIYSFDAIELPRLP